MSRQDKSNSNGTPTIARHARCGEGARAARGATGMASPEPGHCKHIVLLLSCDAFIVLPIQCKCSVCADVRRLFRPCKRILAICFCEIVSRCSTFTHGLSLVCACWCVVNEIGRGFSDACCCLAPPVQHRWARAGRWPSTRRRARRWPATRSCRPTTSSSTRSSSSSRTCATRRRRCAIERGTTCCRRCCCSPTSRRWRRPLSRRASPPPRSPSRRGPRWPPTRRCHCCSRCSSSRSA